MFDLTEKRFQVSFSVIGLLKAVAAAAWVASCLTVLSTWSETGPLRYRQQRSSIQRKIASSICSLSPVCHS